MTLRELQNKIGEESYSTFSDEVLTMLFSALDPSLKRLPENYSINIVLDMDASVISSNRDDIKLKYIFSIEGINGEIEMVSSMLTSILTLKDSVVVADTIEGINDIYLVMVFTDLILAKLLQVGMVQSITDIGNLFLTIIPVAPIVVPIPIKPIADGTK